MKKRIISMILALVMVFTLVPSVAFAASTTTFKVASADALEKALNKGVPADIVITKDFTVDRTFYVSAPTTIRTTSKHTLTRSKYFVSDMFVVGENNKGEDPTLSGTKATLTLGDPSSKTENMLVIDGNRDNMLKALKVSGTALFICNTAEVNIYANTSIINCYKQTNLKTVENDYGASYPSREGGAAVMVTSGTLNIYGGNISNNATNDEDESLTEADSNYRLSSQGGAIYNFGNVKIYGGTFRNNHAARGGVVYNYKKLKIYGGTFEGNTASKYAGVVYCPESQYSNLIMGGSEDEVAKCEGSVCNILFKDNRAVSTGGVIFGQTKTGIVINENANAVFQGNSTERYNGGAIATSGALTIKGGATFVGNDSNSKGGAIYLSNAKEELVTRKPSIANAVFRDNVAARGGAIGLTAKADTYAEGGIATFTGCTFEGNRAIQKTAYGNTEPDLAINGGAFYVSRKSTLTVDDCTFRQNEATLKEGGAIYITAQSRVTVKNSLFDGNKVSDPAEGCGGAVTVHGSRVSITDTEFVNNESARHGAALYCSYKNISDTEIVPSVVMVDGCTFRENVSHYHGGGIYVTTKEDTPFDEATYLKVSNSTFDGNDAANNGAGVYFTKSTGYLKNNTFTNNHVSASASEEGKRYGGAAVYMTASKVDINGATMTDNASDFNGGAVEIHTGSQLTTKDVVATGNSSANHGGAMYINKSTWTDYDGRYEGNTSGTYGGGLAIFTESTARLFNTVSSGNTAADKGGGIYCFGGSESYFENVTVSDNRANGTDTSAGGGGIYITGTKIGDNGESTIVGSYLEMNGCTVEGNHADKGGAVAAFSSARYVINDTLMKNNTVDFRGGAIYSSSGDFDVYNSTFESNSSVDYGGAIAIPSKPVQAGIYGCQFIGNSTTGSGMNGGAIWLYTASTADEEALTVIQDTTFTGNKTTEYGGAIALQNGTKLKAYNITAKDNMADKYGGFLYASSGDTAAWINGMTVSGNTATKGEVIYSGSNPQITLNCAGINDADGDATVALPKWDIANLIDEATEIPAVKKYQQTVTKTPYQEPQEPADPDYVEDEDADQVYEVKERDSVDSVIFQLAEGKPANTKISDTYDKLKKDTNPYNFHGLSQTKFKNINGKTVTCESFILQPGDKNNNTIYPIGLMIYQAMDYKRAHPTKSVHIDVSTFRFSEEVAVNINRDSKYYGYMRNLIGKNYDKNGFVRITYLLVEAAKMGIHVNVIGQIEGMPKDNMSDGFVAFFQNHLKDACDPKYVTKSGKTVGDYMDFHECKWTSYDNLPAADMMHTKICAVDHYRDKDGKDHGNAIWLGSANIDGVYSTGLSGRDRLQTAIVVSDHADLYRTAVNYLKLVAQYCGQEDIKDFREIVSTTNDKQIKLLKAGKTVPADEQIVYLGGKDDAVFELYFAPLGGDVGTWNEDTNPFCKYVKKMNQSDDYILFTYNNVKYVKTSFMLARQLENMINDSFTKNPNKKNRAFIMARSVKNGVVYAFDGTPIEKLKVGKDIGFVSVNKKLFKSLHNKDMQMSYSQNGKREYVSILNSLNFHQGASYYQSNHILVVKETNGMDKNSVFYTIAKYTTNGVVENDVKKSDAKLSKTVYTYDGKNKKPTVSTSISKDDYSVVYPSNMKSVGKHTVKVVGKGIGVNTKSLVYTIRPKGTSVQQVGKRDGKLYVNWKVQTTKMPSSHITGYQIQYATNSKFDNAKTYTVSGYKKTSAKIKNIQSGKLYYVRVRTYKTINGTKYYSTWSKTAYEYDMSKSAAMLSQSVYTYDGQVKKPVVKTSIPSKYYTVSYGKGRKNIGKYSVKLTGKGKVKNSKTLTFTIVPKGTSINSLVGDKKAIAINWKAQTTRMPTSRVTGYQIQYSTSSKFTNAKTASVTSCLRTSKTLKKLKAKTKYYVRIRTYKTVSGTKYYSKWSKAKTVKTR